MNSWLQFLGEQQGVTLVYYRHNTAAERERLLELFLRSTESLREALRPLLSERLRGAVTGARKVWEVSMEAIEAALRLILRALPPLRCGETDGDIKLAVVGIRPFCPFRT